MKKLLILLVFLMFTLSASAMEQEDQYWLCNQVGTIEKKNVLAISNVFAGSGTHEEKEEVFAKATEDLSEGKFEPAFEPSCLDYSSVKKAKKRREKDVKKAKKRKFRLFEIIFSRGS